MKTVAIIQARMGSTRLPGKVLLEVAGRPMLDCVVARAQQAHALDAVAVATSTSPLDDAIVRFCHQAEIPCFRGNEDDVLDRYYQAARHFGADVVVRLTADCPLLDPAVIDAVVQTFHTGDFDYVSNTLEVTYPDGLDTEVFGFKTLERAWREASLKSEREHVTAYIYKHPESFRLGSVKNTPDFSALRWTVDEPADLQFVRAVYAHFGATNFGMAEVLALLQEQPTLLDVNADFVRNEGYTKSLREDQVVNMMENK